MIIKKIQLLNNLHVLLNEYIYRHFQIYLLYSIHYIIIISRYLPYVWQENIRVIQGSKNPQNKYNRRYVFRVLTILASITFALHADRNH